MNAAETAGQTGRRVPLPSCERGALVPGSLLAALPCLALLPVLCKEGLACVRAGAPHLALPLWVCCTDEQRVLYVQRHLSAL